MYYVKIENRRAVRATTAYPRLEGDQMGRQEPGWENRNDWKTFERAKEVAAQLTEATGKLFIATDASASTSPRYDVIDAPVLGSKVSKAFNGDYYPEGEIVKISKSLRRIETSTGVVFFRRRESGAWVADGTWSMVSGHVDKRNPSF